MYEWSKGIVEKIGNANCLTEKELRMVEISLRVSEIHDYILDECLGFSTGNTYELKYRHKRNEE